MWYVFQTEEVVRGFTPKLYLFRDALEAAHAWDVVMSLMSTLDMKRVHLSSDKSSSAFRSRTIRGGAEEDVTCRWTVGPGAYELSSFFSAEKLPTNGHQSAFRSLRRDFVTGPPKTPGPGAYTAKNHSGGWGSRSRQQHVSAPVLSASPSSSSNAFVWTRRATAPSIPSVDTAMGYEEDADGQLVPQDAPRGQYAPPAPNQYTPQSTLTKPRAINGAWDMAERKIGERRNTGAAALAPGHSTGMTANPRPRRTLPASSFATKVEPAKAGWEPWAGPPGAPALPRTHGASRTQTPGLHASTRNPAEPALCPHRAGPGKYETDRAADGVGASRPINTVSRHRRT